MLPIKRVVGATQIPNYTLTSYTDLEGGGSVSLVYPFKDGFGAIYVR